MEAEVIGEFFRHQAYVRLHLGSKKGILRNLWKVSNDNQQAWLIFYRSILAFSTIKIEISPFRPTNGRVRVGCRIPLSFLRFHGKIYNINISPSRENNCFYVFISALSHMEVGRFEFNERPRRPIFPRFSYPVELRVSAQLCFNCTAIINYSPPRRKYSYRCSRVNKGRITLPRRVAPSLMQF